MLAREPVMEGGTTTGPLRPVRSKQPAAALVIAAVLAIATLGVMLIVPLLGAGAFVAGRPRTVSQSPAEAVSVRIAEPEAAVAPAVYTAPMQPRCEDALVDEAAQESRRAQATDEVATSTEPIVARSKPSTRRRTSSPVRPDGLRDPFFTRF